jgi:hypothetical protein
VSQEGFSTYEDEANKFRIEIPQGKAAAATTKSIDGKQCVSSNSTILCAGWQVGAGGTSSFKSVTAFYPEQTADSNGTHVLV